MKRSFYGGNLSEEGDFDLTKQMQSSLGDIDSGLSALDYSANSPDHSSTDSGPLVQNSLTSILSSKFSKSNSAKILEDDERRRIRRERNKMAAAKCRQKRVDQTNMLLEETQALEAEQKKLKEDIQNYEKQKEELEFIMESHMLHCNMKKDYNSPDRMHIKTEEGANLMNPLNESIHIFAGNSPHGSESAASIALKSENGKQFLVLHSGTENKVGGLFHSEVKNENGDAGPFSVDQKKNRLVLESSSNPCNVQIVDNQHLTKHVTVVRPSFFPSTARLTSDSTSTDKQTNSTPTFFAIGLESMMDGHTGLTPITGLSSFAVPGSQLLLTPVISLPTDSLQSLQTPCGPLPPTTNS